MKDVCGLVSCHKCLQKDGAAPVERRTRRKEEY